MSRGAVTDSAALFPQLGRRPWTTTATACTRLNRRRGRCADTATTTLTECLKQRWGGLSRWMGSRQNYASRDAHFWKKFEDAAAISGGRVGGGDVERGLTLAAGFSFRPRAKDG